MVAGVVLHSFNSLFAQELVEKLFHGILMYYINMGASQFLRDYRRASLVKKSVFGQEERGIAEKECYKRKKKDQREDGLCTIQG